MEYQFLTDEERHETLVAFLTAQERDHWGHAINKERFEAILAQPTLSAEFRIRIEKLLGQTNDRLEEVHHIITQTLPQLPEPALVEAAKTRLAAKEADARAARRR